MKTHIQEDPATEWPYVSRNALHQKSTKNEDNRGSYIAEENTYAFTPHSHTHPSPWKSLLQAGRTRRTCVTGRLQGRQRSWKCW